MLDKTQYRMYTELVNQTYTYVCKWLSQFLRHPITLTVTCSYLVSYPCVICHHLLRIPLLNKSGTFVTRMDVLSMGSTETVSTSFSKKLSYEKTRQQPRLFVVQGSFFLCLVEKDFTERVRLYLCLTGDLHII